MQVFLVVLLILFAGWARVLRARQDGADRGANWCGSIRWIGQSGNASQGPVAQLSKSASFDRSLWRIHTVLLSAELATFGRHQQSGVGSCFGNVRTSSTSEMADRAATRSSAGRVIVCVDRIRMFLSSALMGFRRGQCLLA
jgi:hypothetical protein